VDDFSGGGAGRAKTQAWKEWLKSHDRTEVPVPARNALITLHSKNLIRDPATEQDVC